MPQSVFQTAVIKNGNLSESSHGVVVPWWSFTKTVLATAALRLVVKGDLRLDESVDEQPYTLRQLLQHRSGLADYGGLDSYQLAVANMENPWSSDKLLKAVTANELLFSPGTSWAYSNIGYLKIRQLLETRTRQSLDALLQELVFTPLDIDGVRVAQLPEDLPDMAWTGGKAYHPGWVYHGLLIGTVAQAACVLHGLMTSNLLPDSLLTEMKQSFSLGGPVEGRPWQKPGYGLGLMIDTASVAGESYGHLGQGPGSTIAVFHFSSFQPSRTVAVIKQNGSAGEVETLAVNTAL